MNTLKRILILFPLILALVLVMALPASAAAAPSVADEDDLLSADEETKLTAKLDAISEKYEIDIAVATVETLGGEDSISYAEKYYDDNGYGVGDDRSGILLLVCLEYGDFAMTANGKASKIFDNGKLAKIENSFLDYLSEGRYYDAFDAFADECEFTLKYENRLSPIWIVISLVVGAAVAGVVIWRMSAKHKSVKMQKSAEGYMDRNSFRLNRSRDIYLYSTISRVRRPQNSSSSGGRSSGGGRSGRSGKF